MKRVLTKIIWGASVVILGLLLLLYLQSTPIRVGFLTQDPVTIGFSMFLGAAYILGTFSSLVILLVRRPRLPAAVPVETLHVVTLVDCQAIVATYIKENSELFKNEMNALGEQIIRFQKRRDKAIALLETHFSEAEMSYNSYMDVLKSIERIFVNNIKGTVHRLGLFDDEEYLDKTGSKYMSETIVHARKRLYEEHVRMTQDSLHISEEIMFKIDQLTLEFSKVQTVSPEKIAKQLRLSEIDARIEGTKYYEKGDM